MSANLWENKWLTLFIGVQTNVTRLDDIFSIYHSFYNPFRKM